MTNITITTINLVSPPHQLHTPWIRYLDEIFGNLDDIFEISNVIFGHFDNMTNMTLIITSDQDKVTDLGSDIFGNLDISHDITSDQER